MRKIILGLMCLCTVASAQENNNGLSDGPRIQLESQTTGSSGNYAPTWFSSNRYGITSVKPWSNYERISIIRDTKVDSLRNWKKGYGFDLALGFNAPSALILQQIYFETQYKKLRLLIGSKEQPLESRNQELTSGMMLFGSNARPIPQVRLDIDYFSFPGTKGWWKWKMHGSYGTTTEGRWAKNFVEDSTKVRRYAGSVLYHEKALFWKFGKEDCIVPLTYEIALQMACQFGGSSYKVTGRNYHAPTTINHGSGAKDFINALICGGSDPTDGVTKNTGGNHLGSYLMSLKWHGKNWRLHGYFERFFEDQSMMTVQYGIRDHIFGLEATLPRNPFVSNIVVEQMSTRDQSGAVYHDATKTLPEKMNGIDNYYNHNLYNGWENYGMGIGHPFLTSPIYNTDGYIHFYNNRVKAWHVGLNGDPTDELHWRLLLSFTQNWGTYVEPFTDKQNEQYFLAEVNYFPKWGKGWSGKLAFAMDHGNLGRNQRGIGEIGNSFGTQFTIRKSFNIKKKQN